MRMNALPKVVIPYKKIIKKADGPFAKFGPITDIIIV